MNKLKNLLLTIPVSVFAWTAIANAALPPVTSVATDNWHIGAVVWADLLTEDPQAATSFYTDVFGWEITPSSDPDYWLIRSGTTAIGGIALHQPRAADKSETQWLVSVSVADVDATAQLVSQRGGEIFEAPSEVADRGRMAIVADPQGAPFVLLRSATGDPSPAEPIDNQWLWSELWTRDIIAAADFLREVAGYQVKRLPDAVANDTLILGHADRAQLGVVALPFKNVDSHWLSYIAVADLERTLKSIQDNGGSVLLHPKAGDEPFAIASDPTGGVFAVYAWEFGS